VVADTAERDGIVNTLLTAQVAQLDAFVEPKEGMALLALDFTIDNTGIERNGYGERIFSAKDFEQKFESGDTFSTYLAPVPLQTGELVPDNFVRGTMIVEVSEGSKHQLIR
jgi:hypothetical protein